MLYGILNLSFWGYVVVTLVLTHITIMGVTLYLHRHQTHRGIDMHPALAHFFRLWLWLTTGMITKAWVAIHRKHHATVETEEDPHSPQTQGINRVLWQGAEIYRKEAVNKATLEKYGHGTPDDWLEHNVYTKRSAKGILIMLTINILLMGIPGIAIWAIQMMWIPFFAAGVVNGIGHYFGYRNFEVNDASRNIVPWGILIGGEELHNNHHTYGSSAKFSIKWWEFDMGWLYIKLFEFVGLAKVKHLPPQLIQNPTKSTVDIETVRAVINQRFQIMAYYSKQVLVPVFNSEKQKSSGKMCALFDRAKRTLLRSDSLNKEVDKQELSQLLDYSANLNKVYELRNQLQAIWNKTASSQKELIEALTEWCKTAESAGVQVLSDFVNGLRSYTLRSST